MSTKRKVTIATSEWVSPADAARIRGVSRQAINKLIRGGRIKALRIAGKTLLKRADIKNFQPRSPGRKKVNRAE